MRGYMWAVRAACISPSLMLWIDWKEFPHSDGDLKLGSHDRFFFSISLTHCRCSRPTLLVVWRVNSFIMRKRSRNVAQWMDALSLSPPCCSPEGKWAHVCGLCCHMLWWASMNMGGVLSGQITETARKKEKIDVYCHDQVKNNYITSCNLLNHAHGL